MNEEKFDLWCLVELFGHQKIAGRCSERNIAGTNMLQVDVPETTKQPGFTRILSAGAIYAINPITEEIARKIAEQLEQKPITVWEVREMFKKELEQLKPKQLKEIFIEDKDGDSSYLEDADVPW